MKPPIISEKKQIRTSFHLKTCPFPLTSPPLSQFISVCNPSPFIEPATATAQPTALCSVTQRPAIAITFCLLLLLLASTHWTCLCLPAAQYVDRHLAINLILPAIMFAINDTELPLLSFKYCSLLPLFTQNPSILSSFSMSGNTGYPAQSSITVPQALEIARDSEEGARDPTVVNVLEAALTAIWSKIEAQPTTYVMTRDEFAVFNYFQHRFVGHQVAVAARKRYWDNLEVSSGA